MDIIGTLDTSAPPLGDHNSFGRHNRCTRRHGAKGRCSDESVRADATRLPSQVSHQLVFVIIGTGILIDS